MFELLEQLESLGLVLFGVYCGYRVNLVMQNS